MKTFEQWRALNYSVKKGEKSRGKNKKGEPLFDQSQVRANLVLKREGVDYIADAEFWAKANPQALYWQTVKEPHRLISEKAGAILANNLT